MTPLKAYLIDTLVLACLLLAISCSNAKPLKNLTSQIVFVGSTPGDDGIKSVLGINQATKIDFIRWDLTLINSKTNQNTFDLNIVFGELQPNTLGFKGGGEKLSFEGTYTVSQNNNHNIGSEIFRFQSSKFPTGISMVKLNDNLFHLLTPQNRLMVGNGGWSYTLNRKQPIDIASAGWPALAIPPVLPGDTSRQIIFEGRTPCIDIAEEYNIAVSSGCFKLKWKLILNRDPKSLLPTTYQLSRTNNRKTDIVDKWIIVKGTPSNPDAIIYQLDPDKPEKSISFLVGDENVIFFLDKTNQLYVGNSDFSYTLNKRKQ